MEEQLKYRGYCRHAIQASMVWRGPIQDNQEDAQDDLDVHLSDGHISRESAVIDSNNPLWE